MGPGWAEILMFVAVWGSAVAVGSFVGVFVPFYLLSKRHSFTAERRSSTKTAPEIVRERYARGEISRREYEQLRDDLGEDLPAQKERVR